PDNRPAHGDTGVGALIPGDCPLNQTGLSRYLKAGDLAVAEWLRLTVEEDGAVAGGLAVPGFVQVDPIARCAQIRRLALATGEHLDAQLVRVPMATAAGASLEEQTGLALARGRRAQYGDAGGRRQVMAG